MGTLCLESKTVVNLARPCVTTAAKSMCHVVKNRGNSIHFVSQNLPIASLSGRDATEFRGMQHPFVEDDDRRRETDPESIQAFSKVLRRDSGGTHAM